MSNLVFSLIVISAVMHAAWSLLMKRSRHKMVFIWWMSFASSGLVTVALPLASEPFRFADLHNLWTHLGRTLLGGGFRPKE